MGLLGCRLRGLLGCLPCPGGRGHFAQCRRAELPHCKPRAAPAGRLEEPLDLAHSAPQQT